MDVLYCAIKSGPSLEPYSTRLAPRERVIVAKVNRCHLPLAVVSFSKAWSHRYSTIKKTMSNVRLCEIETYTLIKKNNARSCVVI